jgi:hypothetical protein
VLECRRPLALALLGDDLPGGDVIARLVRDCCRDVALIRLYSVAPRTARGAPGTAFIRVPFELADLTGAIADVLADPARAR